MFKPSDQAGEGTNVATWWFRDTSEVVLSCLTLCDPMDCSPPGSSVHAAFQARILEWACHILLQGIFWTRGLNLHISCVSCHWQVDSLPLHHLGSQVIKALSAFQARTLEWVAIPFSRGSFCPRRQTQVYCIAGRFFTIWATSVLPSLSCLFELFYHTLGFRGGSGVKNLPVMQETEVKSLGQEDPLEKEIATCSSILAWRIHGQRSLVSYSPWDHRSRTWLSD